MNDELLETFCSYPYHGDDRGFEDFSTDLRILKIEVLRRIDIAHVYIGTGKLIADVGTAEAIALEIQSFRLNLAVESLKPLLPDVPLELIVDLAAKLYEAGTNFQQLLMVAD